MTVTAVAGVSLWDPMNFPGIMGTVPRAGQSAAVREGNAASARSADDSYTLGIGNSAHNSVHAPSNAVSNALNLAALTSSNSAVSVPGAALVNGIPLSLLSGASSAFEHWAGQRLGPGPAGSDVAWRWRRPIAIGRRD